MDDDERVKAFSWQSKPPTAIHEDDFKNFLGSESESSSDNDQDQGGAAASKRKKDRADLRKKYQSLLNHIGVSVDGGAIAGAGGEDSDDDEEEEDEASESEDEVIERTFHIGLDKKFRDNAKAKDETVYV